MTAKPRAPAPTRRKKTTLTVTPSAAPTGRNIIAQGKRTTSAAPRNESQDLSARTGRHMPARRNAPGHGSQNHSRTLMR